METTLDDQKILDLFSKEINIESMEINSKTFSNCFFGNKIFYKKINNYLFILLLDVLY